MYKEDFENIQLKQRPFSFFIVDIFQELMKQKFKTVQKIRFQPAEISLSVNLFCKKTCSHCVLSVHKLSKHDRVIYGAAKVEIS